MTAGLTGGFLAAFLTGFLANFLAGFLAVFFAAFLGAIFLAFFLTSFFALLLFLAMDDSPCRRKKDVKENRASFLCSLPETATTPLGSITSKR